MPHSIKRCILQSVLTSIILCCLLPPSTEILWSRGCWYYYPWFTNEESFKVKKSRVTNLLKFTWLMNESGLEPRSSDLSSRTLPTRTYILPALAGEFSSEERFELVFRIYCQWKIRRDDLHAWAGKPVYSTVATYSRLVLRASRLLWFFFLILFWNDCRFTCSCSSNTGDPMHPSPSSPNGIISQKYITMSQPGFWRYYSRDTELFHHCKESSYHPYSPFPLFSTPPTQVGRDYKGWHDDYHHYFHYYQFL